MSAANEQRVTSQGVTPSNFTMIPNMCIQELTAYEYKLLAIYMHTVNLSPHDTCWKSNQNLADELGCAVNTMKKARGGLEKKGYIAYTPGTQTEQAQVRVLNVDMWNRNRTWTLRQKEERAKSRIIDLPSNDIYERGVSADDTGVSADDTGVSADDTNKDRVSKSEKEILSAADGSATPDPLLHDQPQPAPEPEPEESDEAATDDPPDITKQARQLIATYKTYSKNVNGSIFGWALGDAKKLVEAGITTDHIRDWYREKSQEKWVQENLNGVPKWSMLAGEIILWRNTHEKRKVEQEIRRRAVGTPINVSDDDNTRNIRKAG